MFFFSWTQLLFLNVSPYDKRCQNHTLPTNIQQHKEETQYTNRHMTSYRNPICAMFWDVIFPGHFHYGYVSNAPIFTLVNVYVDFAGIYAFRRYFIDRKW